MVTVQEGAFLDRSDNFTSVVLNLGFRAQTKVRKLNQKEPQKNWFSLVFTSFFLLFFFLKQITELFHLFRPLVELVTSSDEGLQVNIV